MMFETGYTPPWPQGYTGAQDMPLPFAGNMGDATPTAANHSDNLSPNLSWSGWWGGLPKRAKVVGVLLLVIAGWWLLGKLHPAVRKAHRAVAPNIAGSAATMAAVGI